MALANIDIKATMNEYRPCMVKYNGEEKKGLFHRWIEKENLLIKFDSYLTGKHMLDIKQHCDNEHIIPGDCNAIVIRNTLALVEFEDGTIGEVEPTNVRFLDSEEKFEEYGVFSKFPDSEPLIRCCQTCKHRDCLSIMNPCKACIADLSSWPGFEPKED